MSNIISPHNQEEMNQLKIYEESLNVLYTEILKYINYNPKSLTYAMESYNDFATRYTILNNKIREDYPDNDKFKDLWEAFSSYNDIPLLKIFVERLLSVIQEEKESISQIVADKKSRL